MSLRHVLACALVATLPAIAAAQQASAIGPAVLRAGPDNGYPLVASYEAGAPLTVQGCTEGYVWCDVIGPNGYRGWVHADNLGYPYQQRVVPVARYGPAIGFPIVAFALAPYWAAHYANRPWYRERVRWARYRPVVVAPRAVVVHPAPARAVVVAPRRAVVAAPPPPYAVPPPPLGGPPPPAPERGQ